MSSDSNNDVLFDAFLKQLQELDKFRITHIGRYRDSILDRDDPDIRRLIEAMAMFTARTHLMGERSIRRSHTRLFQQHFSYLLDPTPPMSLIQASTTPRFVDPKVIPVGTTVELEGKQPSSLKRTEEPALKLTCKTLTSLTLMPITLESVETYRQKDQSYELLLRFRADFARLEPLETLQIHLNCYNDFRSSATVHFQLREHLEKGRIEFQPVGNATTEVEHVGCDITFDTLDIPEEDALLNRPLERSRSFFSFPQQKLFFNITPNSTPKKWSEFAVILKLAPQWPAELKLSSDMFHLNVIPVANMVRDFSNPVLCDGTRERYRLRSKSSDDTQEIMTIEGVYRTAANELHPLLPGVIEEDDDCYEVEHEEIETRRQSWLYLQLKDALEEPQTVAIDAWWYSRQADDVDLLDWGVELFDRHIDGVTWQKSFPIVPAMKNAFSENMNTLMHLLSIKHKKILDLEDLRQILTVLGVESRGFLIKPFRAIHSLDVEPLPYSLSSAGMKYCYTLRLGPFEPEDLPLAYLLGAEILEILRVWNSEEVIELVMDIPALERRFTFQ